MADDDVPLDRDAERGVDGAGLRRQPQRVDERGGVGEHVLVVERGHRVATEAVHRGKAGRRRRKFIKKTLKMYFVISFDNE